ncbi:MAG: tetratricopeptide repeat protein [Prevotella pallens]|jgi:tetratricopeptide repeat protein|uniref:Lipoprotein NlpI n=2 Tax=Prevotella pallens TaxID=60133 RepID=A0A379F1C6_9BACT|nr:tetratricopeptide repeat protein [Prevotella pallens]MBF1443205.1 tetratricopeptide repeat protein [Prevotella pallens]MBF1450663.1 tetratricopeptide repeat protein [Prevotella pallens]MBF1458714.1 tetratricopeptide repeat protein [Prevotella pallens]MBF1464350.1 tetratricopeptide repeat protein [Prevotella pallens]MBF1466905.1 tetratricopeptide repeat protein [Prevotella pallens]
MEEGRNSLSNGYYISSLDIFQRIVALKPNLYEAWYLMALSKYHLEDYKGAYEDCEKALELQPYIADIYDLYGLICIHEEKYDKAADAYTKAIEINNDNREFWFNRAYSLYMKGCPKEALQQLSSVLKRWPDLSVAQALWNDIKLGKKPIKKNSQKSGSKYLRYSLPKNIPELLQWKERPPKL